MAEGLTTIINAILLTFRFTWRSPKFVYCAMSIFGSSVMTIFNILRIVATGVNSTKMSKIFQDALHLRRNNPVAITPVIKRKYNVLCSSFILRVFYFVKLSYQHSEILILGSRISICYLVGLRNVGCLKNTFRKWKKEKAAQEDHFYVPYPRLKL